MASVTLPDTITAGSDMVAGEVQGNFEALKLFLEQDAAHRDGSRPFTSIPSAPTGAPSSAGALITKSALDKRTGQLARRVHSTTSLYMTHEGITDSGITLPQFQMPDLSDDFAALRFEVFIPQLTIDSHAGHTPDQTMTMEFRLTVADITTVAFCKAPVHVSMFSPDDVPSVSFHSTLFNNDLLSAGQNINIKLRGKLSRTGGKVQLVGTATAPIVLQAYMMGG